MEDKFKEFIQDEFIREADQIEAEVLADNSLDHVKVTPNLYEELRKKIKNV